MNVCGLTRVLIPAFLMGMAVSTLFASDALGWAAVAITATAVLLAGRIRGTATACAYSPSQADPGRQP